MLFPNYFSSSFLFLFFTSLGTVYLTLYYCHLNHQNFLCLWFLFQWPFFQSFSLWVRKIWIETVWSFLKNFQNFLSGEKNFLLVHYFLKRNDVDVFDYLFDHDHLIQIVWFWNLFCDHNYQRHDDDLLDHNHKILIVWNWKLWLNDLVFCDYYSHKVKHDVFVFDCDHLTQIVWIWNFFCDHPYHTSDRDDNVWLLDHDHEILVFWIWNLCMNV